MPNNTNKVLMNFEIQSKGFAVNAAGAVSTFTTNATIFDDPRSRPRDWRIKRIHAPLGIGQDAEPSGGTHYLENDELRPYGMNAVWTQPRRNVGAVLSGRTMKVVNYNGQAGEETFFTPFVASVQPIPIAACSSGSVATWAAGQTGTIGYVGAQMGPGQQAYVPAWMVAGMVPLRTRCIDTGSALVWIFQGSPTTRAAMSARSEAASEYRLVDLPDPQYDYCSLTERGLNAELDLVGPVYGEERLGYISQGGEGYVISGTETIGFQQDLNGQTWVENQKRAFRFIYALVVPHATGYADAWDAEIELTDTQMSVPYLDPAPTTLHLGGVVMDDGNLLVGSCYGADGQYRRITLNLTTKAFSVSAPGTSSLLAPGRDGVYALCEQDVMTSAGGEEVFTHGNTLATLDRATGALVTSVTTQARVLTPHSTTVTKLEENRYLVSGDMDCSLGGMTDAHYIYPPGTSSGDVSTNQSTGPKDWGAAMAWWQSSTSRNLYSTSPHRHRTGAIVYDVSNLDRFAASERPLIRPDKVAWIIPVEVPSVSGGAGPMPLIDLEIPETGLVTFAMLNADSAMTFRLFTADGAELVFPKLAGVYHKTLAVRLEAGLYSLKAGKYVTLGSENMTAGKSILVIDCGYRVP